jgi:hypothetical protein
VKNKALDAATHLHDDLGDTLKYASGVSSVLLSPGAIRLYISTFRLFDLHEPTLNFFCIIARFHQLRSTIAIILHFLSQSAAGVIEEGARIF